MMFLKKAGAGRQEARSAPATPILRRDMPSDTLFATLSVAAMMHGRTRARIFRRFNASAPAADTSTQWAMSSYRDARQNVDAMHNALTVCRK